MHKFEIVLNLKNIAEAKRQKIAAVKEFDLRIDKAMRRLIHEAAAARMSIPEVARLSGFSTHQIKQRMRAMDLNPTTGRTLLSGQAADVLASNAEILGIEPSEIDLMSPLAYLPAGSLLKEKVSSVTDLDEGVSGNEIDPDSEEVWQFTKAIVADMDDEIYGDAGGHVLRDDPRNLALRLMRQGYRLPQTDRAGA